MMYDDDKRKHKDASFINSIEGKKVIFIEDSNDKENIDGVCGHLEAVGHSEHKPGIYEKCFKRLGNLILSGLSLIILSSVYLIVIIAIKADDPGPVLFTQKRVGKNKKYFKLHNLSSRKVIHCLPIERPTQVKEVS